VFVGLDSRYIIRAKAGQEVLERTTQDISRIRRFSVEREHRPSRIGRKEAKYNLRYLRRHG
jgi:hypothetical protein